MKKTSELNLGFISIIMLVKRLGHHLDRSVDGQLETQSHGYLKYLWESMQLDATTDSPYQI